MQSLLDAIPDTTPTLQQATLIQEKVAAVGFDWPNVAEVIMSLQDEIRELQEVIETEQVPERLQDEFGDIMLCCINLARHLKVNPEQALRHAIEKFTQRFQRVERILQTQAKSFSELSFEDMLSVWETAKKELAI